MNKRELIDAAAEKAGVSKKVAADIVNAAVEAVSDALVKGDKVQVPGFGTFEVSERGARIGRNPQTGEEITIAAGKVPKFHAGKTLKDAVNAAV